MESHRNDVTVTHKTLAIKITLIITRLIVIYIAPLPVSFCNCPLFCNCPPLKDISFNTKCLLVWCD